MTTYWVVSNNSGQYSIVSTQTGSAQDTAFTAGNEYNGQFVIDNNGFPSLAKAKAAIPAIAAHENVSPSVFTYLGKLIINGKASPAPGASPVSALGATAAGVQTVENAASSLYAPFAEFIGRLENAKTWERIGEFVIGIVLIAVGLTKLTGSGQVIGNAVKLTPQGKVASKIGLL